MAVHSGSAPGAISAIGSSTVTTAESTTSLTYTDLSTVGPSVTINTGSSVILIFGSSLVKTSAGAGNTGFVSVAVSGATTSAASDTNDFFDVCETSAFGTSCSRMKTITGLTPGSNTFTLKYRCDGGTWQFGNRDLTVLVI